jgi:tRNA pseudouridine38-40 synthase
LSKSIANSIGVVESAEKEGVFETYQARQEDATSFWEDAEEVYVKPILDKLDPELRASVMVAIHSSEEEPEFEKKSKKSAVEKSVSDPISSPSKRSREDDTDVRDEYRIKKIKEAGQNLQDLDLQEHSVSQDPVDTVMKGEGAPESTIKPHAETESSQVNGTANPANSSDTKPTETSEDSTISKSVLTPLEAAIKEVKAAYIAAKKAYRISTKRRARVQEALNAYLGTRNFHNYTIQKSFKDPSAKRVIRSFNVGKDPVIINDTEWLSLKVHGQSFMMHQIRKMVAMAALVVRCGSPISIMQESYGPANISIPKAPGLGLLLERPVFETYNEKAAKEFSREKIDFDKFQKEIDEFKQREIYDRIFREEEKDHQ